jgi:hypothetical protein
VSPVTSRPPHRRRLAEARNRHSRLGQELTQNGPGTRIQRQLELEVNLVVDPVFTLPAEHEPVLFGADFINGDLSHGNLRLRLEIRRWRLASRTGLG